AAVMKVLDLVITSDTAIPHLAGALAVPVWMATPSAPDWRWLRQGEDNPWYPTLRMFRQRQLGEWAEVFERIAGELKQRLATLPGGGRPDALAAEAEAGHQQALTLIREGKLAEAARELERALQLKPDHVDAL